MPALFNRTDNLTVGLICQLGDNLTVHDSTVHFFTIPRAMRGFVLAEFQKRTILISKQ